MYRKVPGKFQIVVVLVVGLANLANPNPIPNPDPSRDRQGRNRRVWRRNYSKRVLGFCPLAWSLSGSDKSVQNPGITKTKLQYQVANTP